MYKGLLFIFYSITIFGSDQDSPNSGLTPRQLNFSALDSDSSSSKDLMDLLCRPSTKIDRSCQTDFDSADNRLMRIEEDLKKLRCDLARYHKEAIGSQDFNNLVYILMGVCERSSSQNNEKDYSFCEIPDIPVASSELNSPRSDLNFSGEEEIEKGSKNQSSDYDADCSSSE